MLREEKKKLFILDLIGFIIEIVVIGVLVLVPIQVFSYFLSYSD